MLIVHNLNSGRKKYDIKVNQFYIYSIFYSISILKESGFVWVTIIMFGPPIIKAEFLTVRHYKLTLSHTLSC